ncbi:MAG: site-specific integrase [Planctomycetes bacterium]|nr:site-specific integrase [Planctomycetota bacterium]
MNGLNASERTRTSTSLRHKIWYGGKACKPKTVADITPRMIRDFLKHLIDDNKSRHTANRYVREIKSALSYAVQDGILPFNKLLRQKQLFAVAQNKLPRILEVGEVTALMNAAKERRMKTVISLAYYHGMRKGEISYLQWCDVNTEDLTLNIVDRPGIHRTKNHKSRTIALRPETAKLLMELYQDRANEFVFSEPKTFYEFILWEYKKLVKKTGMDHCTLHDLRKTCNTLMKDAGVSIEAAMQVLGHKSLQVNQDHYTGILMKQQRIAVDSLPSIG